MEISRIGKKRAENLDVACGRDFLSRFSGEAFCDYVFLFGDWVGNLCESQFRNGATVSLGNANRRAGELDNVADFWETAETLGDKATGCNDVFLLFVQGFAGQFGKVMQREVALDGPGVVAARFGERFFLVEFVLNLTDKFLEDIFER